MVSNEKTYTVIKEWSHSNLPCMIILTSMGHLCGYTGITENHPWFEKKYNQCLEGCEKVPHKPNPFGSISEEQAIEWANMMNRLSGGHWPCVYDEEHKTIEGWISVHGGVTFTGEYKDQGGKTSEGGIWWIGFDCSHAGDYNPSLAMTLMKTGYYDHLLQEDVYRDEDYVTKETEQMAEQIKSFK